MIGYKATENMKCLTLTYEIGKIYQIDNMKMCNHGFHFCKKQEDVTNYYNYSDDFMLLEIEALGEIITENNKSVTNKIKVLRVIPKEEYSKELLDKFPIDKYDKNNNLIYYKDSNGYECWKEFDKNNNLIYSKSSSGYEFWKEFDKNNNLIHSKDSNGKEWKIAII